MKRYWFLYLFIFLTSCRVLNPSLMFKTPADYKYADFSGKSKQEYRIRPYDQLELKMYTNEGLRLVELMPVSSTGGLNQDSKLEFLVDKDGFIRMPVAGNLQIGGLTIAEAQVKIEKSLSEFYIKPYVQAKVNNKRVLIFPGSGGSGSVVTLKNENTTLLEALALAGGISTTGKAYKVKLVRGPIDNPSIQLIDLSTIEGMKKANIAIQPNDVVYVEPVRNISQNIITQITPFLAILTTAIFISQLARK